MMEVSHSLSETLKNENKESGKTLSTLKEVLGNAHELTKTFVEGKMNDTTDDNLTLFKQRFQISVDAPVGRKYFFSILKRLIAFVVFECFFKLPFSDLHFKATSAGDLQVDKLHSYSTL